MKGIMNIKLQLLAVGIFVSSTSAHSALVSRLGGLAYYDTDADLTWLADANYSVTQYVNSGGTEGDADGRMHWADANVWATGLNIAGITGWRVAKTVDIGNDGCNLSNNGTDCGYNMDVSTGEMANLFYTVLENVPYKDTDGNANQPGWGGVANTGPFSNVLAGYYWSSTEYAPDTSKAWVFSSFYSNQTFTGKSASNLYAWAVHDGDVDPDTDMDGISDSIEDSNGNGVVDAGETDPMNPDSDSDGLLDGDEDSNSNGIVDAGESDPLDTDSDDDFLPDGYEVNILASDPTSQTTVYLNKGDMDVDGDVDVGDLILIQRQLLGY